MKDFLIAVTNFNTNNTEQCFLCVAGSEREVWQDLQAGAGKGQSHTRVVWSTLQTQDQLWWHNFHVRIDRVYECARSLTPSAFKSFGQTVYIWSPLTLTKSTVFSRHLHQSYSLSPSSAVCGLVWHRRALWAGQCWMCLGFWGPSNRDNHLCGELQLTHKRPVSLTHRELESHFKYT